MQKQLEKKTPTPIVVLKYVIKLNTNYGQEEPLDILVMVVMSDWLMFNWIKSHI